MSASASIKTANPKTTDNPRILRKPSRLLRRQQEEVEEPTEGGEDFSDTDEMPEIDGLDMEVEISDANVFAVTEKGVVATKFKTRTFSKDDFLSQKRK